MALNSVGAQAAGNAFGDFIDTYLKSKQMKQTKDYQDQSLQLQQAEHGLIKDPETGLLKPSPAAQGKMSYESAQYDSSNPVAEQTRGLLKDQIKQVHPDYSDEQIEALAPKGQSAKQYGDSLAQMKPAVGGAYMVQSRAPMAAAMGERNDIARQGLGLREKTAANAINKQVVGDPIVKATDMQQNSIAKGEQQLNSTDKPITNQMLNEIQNDYANAITGGRQAAQGTIHDQQMQSLEAKAANLKQYITGKPEQAATPEQIKYFKTAFGELKGLNQQIRQSRVNSLTGGAEAAYGNKGAFGNVIGNLKENANGQGLIPEQKAPPSQAPAPNNMDRNQKIQFLLGL